MTDHLTQTQRSWNMSRIRSKNTGPERMVRSELHRLGYRFRLHRYDLPGKPDLILPKYKTAIFVHGCFWHQHKGCENAAMPSTNVNYWRKKFARNAERDRNDRKKLQEMGWKVIIVWECELEDMNNLADSLCDAL